MLCARSKLWSFSVTTCLLTTAITHAGEQLQATPNVSALFERLQAAEHEIQRLKNRPATPEELFPEVAPANFVAVGNAHGDRHRSTVAACGLSGAAACTTCPPGSRFYVDYDNGFVIRPFDKQVTPFELKFQGWMQLRYNGFHSEGPTPSRNNLEIERGRMIFRGFAYDPNLQYFINIDADTDEQHVMKFHDFWFNYKFSDAFNLHGGKGKVAGSYTWYLGGRQFRLIDRDTATTFFRSDRTIGLWALGDFGEQDRWHYHALIGNGLRTADFTPGEVDDLIAASMMLWWDATGDYGQEFSDLEWHDELAVRTGQTFAWSNQNQGPEDSVLPEARWVRLGNGTRLTDTGALAPGVTVTGFDYFLYSAFFLAKYQGWSANAEFYYRWINNFDTAGGGSPYGDLQAHGFYAEVGRMLCPKYLELVGRICGINTSFGDSWEYGAGINWFLDGTHNNKFQVDLLVLDDVPTSNSGPNYEVGQTGIMCRAQYQIAF